jgi:hypothetical protein
MIRQIDCSRHNRALGSNKPGLLLLAGLALLLPWFALGAELPQADGQQHLGVATCASGVCHGSVRPRTGSDVLQNEYVTWSQRDRHRVAYQTLLTKQSQQIADNLGLANAHEAGVCLDCHADNVPEALRGTKFVISDGVGCEACHGGAENYMSVHADSAAKRQLSLDAGLYPTDVAVERASLCLSCHLGTAEKMASHDIMGAGHPRLAFELDTFGILQPAHYVVDADYRAEKWHGQSLTVWIIGQTRSATAALNLIATRLDKGGLFPELALFDCQACHHAMSEPRWQAANGTGLPPGSVRLNDANFVMLFAIGQVVAPALESTLREQMLGLHQAVAQRQPLATRIAAIRGVIQQIEDRALAAATPQKAAQFLQALVNAGADGEFGDYVAAEQAVMAIDMLLNVADLRDQHGDWLNLVYSTVGDEDHYDPSQLAAVMLEFGH